MAAYDINGDGPFVKNGITIEWVYENFEQRGPDVHWRKQNRRGDRKMNKPAGVIGTGGHRRITSTGIHNRFIFAHHVAFALAHRRFPRYGMDAWHIDGDPTNNCPSNLREVKRGTKLRAKVEPA